MIELRMIVPPSAITPISASGAVMNTMNSRDKLCS
jgi:hypothetical protein